MEVSIGNRVAGNVEFLSRPSHGFAEAGLDVDGVLGQSLLSRFDYLLDYKSRELILDNPEPAGNGGARIPFTYATGRMLLPAVNPSEGSMRLIVVLKGHRTLVVQPDGEPHHDERASFGGSFSDAHSDGRRPGPA